MKQIKRVFTCLLCFSLLLSCSLFSVGVSAESVSDYIIEYKVYDHSILPSGGNKGQVLGQDTVSHGENSIKSTTNVLGNFVINDNTQYMIQLAVFKSDYSTMFRKDDTATITLDYLVSYFTLGTTRNDLKKLDILNYRFLYTDGTYSSWNDLSSAFNYVADSNTHNYSLKFTAEKDIKSVIFREWYKPKNQWGYNGTYQNDVTIGFGSANWSITSVTESKESGLLSGILEWIKGIFNKIGDMFDTIASGFSNIGKWFAELPSKLWTVISDGLKALFIPSSVVNPETGQEVEYFTYYFDQWDDWMNDHFGVLYFPFAILFDVLEQILTFNPPANPSITFPGLEIMGQTLLKPIDYHFETFNIPWLNTAHDLYLFAVDAIIGFWIVRLAYKKLTEILGGGS